MKSVGILGGMGPQATILLMQKVLDAVQAGDDADHIPLIVHQNPQVPSRIKVLIEGQGTDPGPVLARMAHDLEQAGARALAMPCNTAHHYADAVRAASDVPFLDMLRLTATILRSKGATRVGMLASPATRITGVFDAIFAEVGLVPVWTDSEDDMLSLIRAVKAGEPMAPIATRLRSLADAMVDADHWLVACTELSLLTHALNDGPGWTDSLDCLVDGIVAFAKGCTQTQFYRVGTGSSPR